jgi:lipoate-protein ligase A
VKVQASSTISFGEALRLHAAWAIEGGPAVHVGVLDAPVLSIGVGVADDRPYLRSAERIGLPIARRSSGGTGLIALAGDLVWAVVLPRLDPRVGNDYVRAYDRLGAGLVEQLGAYGVRARWAPAPGLVEAYCPLSARGQVLEANGAIVGAAAQHATHVALLHHGTLSRSIDRTLIDRVFELADPEPLERLGGLDELGIRTPAEELARTSAAALAAALEPP